MTLTEIAFGTAATIIVVVIIANAVNIVQVGSGCTIDICPGFHFCLLERSPRKNISSRPWLAACEDTDTNTTTFTTRERRHRLSADIDRRNEQNLVREIYLFGLIRRRTRRAIDQVRNQVPCHRNFIKFQTKRIYFLPSLSTQ